MISSIACKFASRRIESGDKSKAWWPQLHSFAVGLKGAPDLAKAREVADYIGTIHHVDGRQKTKGMFRITAKLDTGHHCPTIHINNIRIPEQFFKLSQSSPNKARLDFKLFISIYFHYDIAVPLVQATRTLL